MHSRAEKFLYFSLALAVVGGILQAIAAGGQLVLIALSAYK